MKGLLWGNTPLCCTTVYCLRGVLSTCAWSYDPCMPKFIEHPYKKWYYHESNTQIQKYKWKITFSYSIWRSARKTKHAAYFWNEDCSRISKMIFPWVKHTNTKIQTKNTQIHIYSTWWSARKTQHVVDFWKENCSTILKIIFLCAERAMTKIQNTKYTNTQIQHMTKCQRDPTSGIFLKRRLFKDIKNYIAICQTPKFKNMILDYTKYTNTQIQHMPKCQKDPTCGRFLKRGSFKDIFWVSHSCTRSSCL